MKQLLLFVGLAAMLLAPMTGATDSADSLIAPTPASIEASICDTDTGASLLGFLGTTFEQRWGGLPSCWQVDGTTCYQPGTFTRCQWQPGEPEICICQSNYTYNCPG